MRLLLFFILFGLVHGQEFFNETSFSKKPAVDQLLKSMYAEKLEALGEQPVLKNNGSIVESYRFTWLRTSHHPVAMRIDVAKDGTAHFTLKVSDGRGGYDPGKLFRDEKWKLSGESLKRFKETFADTAFYEQEAGEETTGMDGSRWLIEARRNGKYHAISRWSPREGAAWVVGMAFLRIAVDDFSQIY